MKISLIIPFCKVPHEIFERRLESLLAFQEREAEFIFINDGSPDAELVEMVTQAATRDGRVRLFELS